MRFKSFLTNFLMIMVIVAVVAGCTQSGESNSESNNEIKTELDKLKIGTLPIEDNLAILVAAKNGYFAAENLEVELVSFQSPVESQSAFQSGELDGMVTDMTVAALLKSAGEDLRVTSLTLGANPQEGRFAIVAAPQSTIETVADLKGKSIGISTNSIIEYVTDGLLEEGGVNPSEVNKTTVAKIPLRVEMLLSNQIDAITVPDPQVSYVVAQGAKVIAEDTKGENMSQAVIIMTGKTISEKREAVTRFFKAYAKAVDDINNEPEQYQELLIDNMNIPESIAKSYGVQRYSKPQLPAKKEVNNIITWLKNKNLLKNEINYEDFIQKELY